MPLKPYHPYRLWGFCLVRLPHSLELTGPGGWRLDVGKGWAGWYLRLGRE